MNVNYFIADLEREASGIKKRKRKGQGKTIIRQTVKAGDMVQVCSPSNAMWRRG